MRVRKKKHLSERLNEVSDLLFIADSTDRNFNTAVLKKEYVDLDSFFQKRQPLYLEIGCGKGRFAAELARQNPDINVLGIEKESNVIVSACEAAKKLELPNLRFFRCSAEYLPKYLRDHTAKRIYLNFSCPFPKSKYASHRLTSPRFLDIYKALLTEGGEIHQKTDNRGLFEFSIENLTAAGFKLKNVSLDLHNSNFEGNIVTEYEEKFVKQGLPIYRLEAYM